MKMSDNYLCQLLDTLTDLGLLENTLIIRTADHGEMGLTHGGQRQKNFNFYEESTRVPLVYSNPILCKQSFKSKSIVSHVDFLTTIAKDNGWEVYIDHTLAQQGYVLHFQFLMQDYSPSVTLQWGQSLMDFTPRITTVGDVFGVSARIWISTLQLEFVIVVG